MHNSKLHQWINETPQRKVTYAQESLIVDVTEEIWSAMSAQNVSKSDLAKRLGKSKAFVTQVLNGGRNMTLRTLSDIAFVLDLKPCVRLLREHESKAWYSSDVIFINTRRVLVSANVEVGNEDYGPIAEVREAA